MTVPAGTTPAADAAPHVLVIGSGLAGLSAVLAAVAAGAEVMLVTKSGLMDTATDLAQGGMAAMTRDLPGGQALDSPQKHVADTVAAGAGLTSHAVAERVVGDSSRAVLTLLAEGVDFDRQEGPGSPWVQGMEAAHYLPRILHAGGDATGHAVQVALTRRVRGLAAAGRLTVHTHTLVTDLVTDAHGVRGAALRDVECKAATTRPAPGRAGAPLGPQRFVAADHVVLATGGAGQLYPFTTNPAVATGDGVALALRAGARVQDLEFVQFHPTALAAEGCPLISEAVRGEGATLVDGSGHRFMTAVDPRAELAPRDVVARAVFRARSHAPGAAAYLDLSTVRVPDGLTRAEFLERRFPTIHRTLAGRGVDWAAGPVPVSPAAHYLMGGVRTDQDGRTNVPGLWAVGECAATGLHGANRLASNSLLEAAVVGRAAGRLAACATRGEASPDPAATWLTKTPRAPEDPVGRAVPGPGTTRAPALPAAETEDLVIGSSAGTGIPFSRAALQQLMWRHAGVMRTKEGLLEARRTLEGWHAAASALSADGRSAPGLAEHEDRNLLLVALAVVRAALARTESRGAHHRVDHPEPDPLQARHRTWRLLHTAPEPQPARVAAHRCTEERGVHADAHSR